MAQIDALDPGAAATIPISTSSRARRCSEGGKPAEAIAPLRRAVQLAPNPTLIQVMLGQALVASNDPRMLDEAVSMLRSRARAASRNRPTATTSSPWPMAARATSPMPISPPRRRRFPRGDMQDRAQLAGARQGPLPGRLARLGARPTTSPAASRRAHTVMCMPSPTRTPRGHDDEAEYRGRSRLCRSRSLLRSRLRRPPARRRSRPISAARSRRSCTTIC